MGDEAATRSLLLNRALWLERLTILWNVAEAVIAVGAGWLAGSIALVGFGLDSVIETAAAAALYDASRRCGDSVRRVRGDRSSHRQRKGDTECGHDSRTGR